MNPVLPAALLLAVTTACAAPAAGRLPEGAGLEPHPVGRVEDPQVKLGEKPPDPAAARERAVERAKAHLSKTLEVPAAEIQLISAKAVSWPDASLGCPQPDHMYAQVVTDGHEVVLEAEGAKHELHVGPKSVVVCRPRL